jgi:hypothetical protein
VPSTLLRSKSDVRGGRTDRPPPPPTPFTTYGFDRDNDAGHSGKIVQIISCNLLLPSTALMTEAAGSCTVLCKYL